MNKLLAYLHSHYKPGELIFLKDIKLDKISNSSLRVYMKRLVDNGTLMKSYSGAYYIPKKVTFNNKTVTNTIIEEDYIFGKYIKNNNKIFGYYSHYTLANMLGLSSQVPYVLEIRTNNTKSKVRKIEIDGRSFIIRKSYVKITNDNVQVLELLDILKDLDEYIDLGNEGMAKKSLADFIVVNNISLEDVKKYIGHYPAKVYKTIFEGGFYELFTQQSRGVFNSAPNH